LDGRICPTPFAADSGFAASGYAPRASNRFGQRRCLACPAAAAETNRYAARRQQDEVACAICVALWHSILSSMRAQRRVGGWVILRGRVRVAGTRGRVR